MWANNINPFSFSLTLPRTKIATAAGTNVTEKIKAPSKAATTVKAIGWNILPSTPLKAKIGKYTSIIINTPKTAGLNTSRVLITTSFRRSSIVNNRPKRCWANPSRRSVFSTTITAPSTIKPKSIAPKLIKLPETLLLAIPVIANNMLNGITKATIKAACILPNKTNSTTITSMAPSKRLFFTVTIVLSTSSVRL